MTKLGCRVTGRIIKVLAPLVLCCSCRVTDISELPGSYGELDTLPDRFTLVVWNVQKGFDPSLEGDLECLLAEDGVDLLMLQEATDRVAGRETMPGLFARSWKYPWPGGEAVGVITASPVRPVGFQSLPSVWREFFITAPKCSLATRYRLQNGEELLAVNVHLLTYERFGTMKFRSQLREIDELLRDHTGPILLAGDFNTWNEKRYRIVSELMDKLDLDEVLDFEGDRSTADTKSGFLNWVMGVEKDRPLDRIYVRGLQVETAVVSPGTSSDHNPLKAVLVLD